MSSPHTLNRFHRSWSALAAALISIVCCSQQRAQAAIIHVTTTQQGVTSNLCSLQEAIYASTFRSSQAIRSTNPDVFYNTGCTAGTGDDTIVLAPGEHYAFDHFWDGDSHNVFGPTATPIIVSIIIIEGNGATLQSFDGFRPNNSRLFAIGLVSDPNFPSTVGSLTLRNVYIKDFHVKGGDGATGGGGGLGAGGAIFTEGSLTVENSTFEHNGAVGGNGTGGEAGGGGGLTGNGGAGCPRSAGGGGGAGGKGGNGGVAFTCPGSVAGGGGGGGGTVLAGGDGTTGGAGVIGGPGGFRCGGRGGDGTDDGNNATCRGGGGGGGGGNVNPLCWLFGNCYPDGGDGAFGGGGGGGLGNGAKGGFGGGGGAGDGAYIRVKGGNGGFAGGGGAAGYPGVLFHRAGRGGLYGGNADDTHGGGGGALGGAIFNRTGTVIIQNSTFFNNFVTRGEGGGGSADKGADAGGAIFSMGQSLDVNDSTFSGNQSTGSGGAIVAIVDTDWGSSSVKFALNNTIIANNGAEECYVIGNVSATGVANLIMQNGSGAGPPGLQREACPQVVTSSDPQLQALQYNGPGGTPTMAITTTSAAADQGDKQSSLATDQRGVPRPQGSGPDIGAFEAVAGRCPEATAFLTRATAIAFIDAPHTTAYNNLICGLVEDGTYSKLDALYVLATQPDNGVPGDGIARLNLIKDNFNLVVHGSCTFAADKGVACDGATGYYDTQLNLSSAGLSFSLDSASLGVYDRTNTVTNGTVFGAFDGGSNNTVVNLNTGGGLYFRINSAFDAPVGPNSNTQGFWIGTRSATNAVTVYRNGAEVAPPSTTPSGGVPPLSMFLCASNFNGTPVGFVPDEVAAFFIGGALNKTQTAGISVRINQFLATFGTNVY